MSTTNTNEVTEVTEKNEASLPDNSSKKDYEILREDFPNYDLSFKVIVIGNSGNYIIIFINK